MRNNVFRNCLFMYKSIWKYSKVRILLIFVLSIADAINILINTFFFKFAIDAILLKKPYNYFIMVLVVRLGYLLIYQCIDNYLHTIIFPLCDNKIKKEFTTNLLLKVSNIDISCFEDVGFYDKYTRAINEVDNRAISMLHTLRGLISIILQTSVLFLSLTFYSPVPIIIAACGMLATFWGNIVNNKKLFKFEQEKTRVQRGLDYVKRIFYLSQYSKDIRTTNIKNIMINRYETSANKYNKVIKKHAPPIAAVAISTSWIFNVFNIGISSLFISKKIYDGVMTVGDFTTVLTAIVNLSINLLQFSNIIPEFNQHSLFISNLLEIINYKTKIASKDNAVNIDTQKPHDIKLEDIHFSYGDNSVNVIDGISLSITSGQKVALVGENGAGKTTLIKLIMRLYDPVKGRILYDRLPYENVKLDDLYKSMSVVHQDFQCYAMSVAENITLKRDIIKDDETRIWELLEMCGLASKVKRMPNSIFCNLTNEFDEDGINLSGGQYQKLVIARALYLNSGVIIMDEPSSALDPLAEKELFDIIDNIDKTKTLILVSHRLSSVKKMDKIFFIEKGKIIEEGSHDELIRLNGKYANMFTMQAERYGL